MPGSRRFSQESSTVALPSFTQRLSFKACNPADALPRLRGSLALNIRASGDTIMTLSVDLKMSGIPVLSVETEISDRMKNAFLDAHSEVLEGGISDLHRQIEAASSAEADDERIGIVNRLQFALACSILSTLTGEVSGE
jgi:hypothetical protein